MLVLGNIKFIYIMSNLLIRRVEYFFLALFLALLIPFLVSAQESLPQPSEQLSEGEVIANVRISDARILSQEPDKLKIGFTLSNQGESTQLDVRYGFELIRVTDKGQAIVDTFVAPETLVIAPGQSIEKQVDYFAPTFLTGEYKLYVVSKTTGGLMLGVSSAGQVTFSGGADYVEILAESCSLSIKGESDKYNLYQGVDIAQSEKFYISCDIISHMSAPQTLSWNFETFKRTLYGAPITTNRIKSAALSLSVKEKKNVSFEIPLPVDPQAYDSTLVLLDARTGAPISNKVSFHFVLRGESATIQNISFDKSSYMTGDVISADVFWSPSADQFLNSRAGEGTAVQEISAILRVVDVQGKICAESRPRSLSPDSLKITITANATSDCVNPAATISLLDKSLNVLDSRTIKTLEKSEYQPKESATDSKENESNLSIWWIVLGGLTFVLISGLIIFMKRKRHDHDDMSDTHNPYKILIFILLFSASFLSVSSEALAVTFMGQSNAWQFSANANKTTYSPGEIVNVDSVIYANVCSNNASDTYLQATLAGQNITLQAGKISGGQSLYGGGQFTAPSSPGDYLIVLEGCGGEFCYSQPKKGVYYSSIPITVAPSVLAPIAWWSPTNITVNQGASYSLSYGSANAVRCDIWKNGVLVGANAPTSYSYNNMVANEPSYTSRLICYNSKGNASTPVDFNLTVLASSVNGSCGAADSLETTVTPTAGLCSAGSQSSVTENPGSYNWSCFGQSGGTNEYCAAPKPSVSTATINAPNCTIPQNASSCDISVSWNSQNATVPSVRQNGGEFSTLAETTGTVRNIGYGTHNFSFFNKGNLVSSDSGEAICATNTAWNSASGRCEQNAVPDLTSTFNLSGTFSLGTAIPLTGIVTNIGNVSVGSFSNNFSYWNGSSWMNINPYLTHPSLAAGGSQATDSGSYTPTQSGTLLLQYCVDSYDDIPDESNESNCTQVSVNVTNTQSQADLTGYDCTIPLSGSDCNGTFTWDIQNSSNPNVKNLTTNTQYSNSATGNNVSRTLQYGSNVIVARSDSTVLKSIEVSANCIAGTTWNNGTCEVFVEPPQISIEANPNIIRANQTTPVIVKITAGYNLQCTLGGVTTNPITFTHIASSQEQTYNNTTRLLTSAQVVQVSCTDGTNVTTRQARIEMIGTIQEI